MDSSAFRRPSTLLDHLGVARPEELDVEAIAGFCGATVRYQPLANSEARIIGFGERAIITVNASASRGRQRFSVGHELGHWLSDRGRVAFECDTKAMTGEWTGTSREQLANRYAADLLLPLPMFCPLTRGKPITFTTVQELANVFEMSLTATAIRLVEHGPLPAMLVCWATDSRRKWFVRGRGVPDVIWPPDEAARHSIAAGLLRGKGGRTDPEEVSAAEWTAHQDADGYVVVEDSRRISSDFVLSLVWWKDESQLLDLDSD